MELTSLFERLAVLVLKIFLTLVSHMRHYCLMTTSIRLNTKDSIIEAAFTLFSRNPGASLGEVAESAGVGRATLHRLFSSRADLVRSLALIAIAEMDTAAEAACENVESASEALRLSLQALIPLGNRHGFLALEPFDSDPEISAEFKRLEAETNALVDASKAEGLFDETIPTDWITQVFDSLLFSAWESVKLGKITNTQAADLAWLTLTKGLGASKL